MQEIDRYVYGYNYSQPYHKTSNTLHTLLKTNYTKQDKNYLKSGKYGDKLVVDIDVWFNGKKINKKILEKQIKYVSRVDDLEELILFYRQISHYISRYNKTKEKEKVAIFFKIIIEKFGQLGKQYKGDLRKYMIQYYIIKLYKAINIIEPSYILPELVTTIYGPIKCKIPKNTIEYISDINDINDLEELILFYQEFHFNIFKGKDEKKIETLLKKIIEKFEQLGEQYKGDLRKYRIRTYLREILKKIKSIDIAYKPSTGIFTIYGFRQ